MTGSITEAQRYEIAEVLVDIARSFGEPFFKHGGAKVSDVLERFCSGESVNELTEEFGAPPEHIEDAIRVALLQSVAQRGT